MQITSALFINIVKVKSILYWIYDMPNLEVNAYEFILLLGCIIIFVACISAAFNNSFDDFSWKYITTWLFIVGSLLMITGYIGYKVYAYYHPYAWLD